MNLKFENLFHQVCTSFESLRESGPIQTWTLIKLKPNAKSVKPSEQHKVDSMKNSTKNIVVIGAGDAELTKTGEKEIKTYVISSEITYGFDDVNSRVLVSADSFDVIKKDINLHPVPDDIKRKNSSSSKPEKIQAKSIEKFETNLTNSNTTLPNGNKWNDSAAGGGNTPKKGYTATRR
jgi:hypothetical protein